MSEVCKATVTAVVFKTNQSGWVQASKEPHRVDLYYNVGNSTCRMIAKCDEEWVLNNFIEPTTKYESPDPRFHQWKDRSGQGIGLRFTDEVAARAFAAAVLQVIQELSQHASPTLTTGTSAFRAASPLGATFQSASGGASTSGFGVASSGFGGTSTVTSHFGTSVSPAAASTSSLATSAPPAATGGPPPPKAGGPPPPPGGPPALRGMITKPAPSKSGGPGQDQTQQKKPTPAGSGMMEELAAKLKARSDAAIDAHGGDKPVTTAELAQLKQEIFAYIDDTKRVILDAINASKRY